MLESDLRPRLDRTRPLAILNRLGNVDGGQHLGAGEIGDRPRDLKDAMELDCAARPSKRSDCTRVAPFRRPRTLSDDSAGAREDSLSYSILGTSTTMSMRSSKGPDIRRW